MTQYLRKAVEGVLHSLQHAAGPLLLREKQFPVEAEQSRELGHTGVGTGRAEDLSYHRRGAAALGIKQKINERILVNSRNYSR